MLIVKKSTQFKKDYKRCQKQGQNMDLLKDIVATLSIPALLPPEKNDHQLVGNHLGERECHITSDWLLIYRVDGSILYLVRTGSHSDLFKL